MKKLLLIILTSLSLSAVAQQKTVAVLDPICRDNSVNAFFQQMVRGAMESSIITTTEYEAYDRSAFDMIQKEQAFQRTGAVNDSQIKKMGEMAGVDYVLVSELSAYNGYLSAVVKILNVTTGKYDKSVDDYTQLTPDAVKKKCSEMASALFGETLSGSIHTSQPTRTTENKDFIENALGINMKMIWVEGGEFLMGCTSEQSDCGEDEKNVRRVKLDGYYIGMLEVTQEQWKKVMGTSLPEIYQSNVNDLLVIDEETGDTIGASPFWLGQEMNLIGNSYPMYDITSWDATEFCRKLSNKAGRKYSLPTEAQWEYAARGGKKSKQTKYSGSNNVQDVAWYYDNSKCPNDEHCVKPGGMKRPNELGIYDMSGNVSEWCSDIYSSSYINYDIDNPTGPKETDISEDFAWTVHRGGSYRSHASECRTSARNGLSGMIFDDYIGFRVVCIPFRDSNKDNGVTSSNKIIPNGYVDLGLPSGTLWKRNNEECGLISFDEAWTLYGTKMPTKEQWEELRYECVWTWLGNGYKVIGTNGNYIFLPAEGSSNDCQGKTNEEGIIGSYWLSSDPGSGWKAHAYRQSFHSEDMYTISLVFRCQKGSVHLVY